jgi:hypothetical protein
VCEWKLKSAARAILLASPPQVGGFGFPIRNQISGNGPVNDFWNAHKSSTPWQLYSR